MTPAWLGGLEAAGFAADALDAGGFAGGDCASVTEQASSSGRKEMTRPGRAGAIMQRSSRRIPLTAWRGSEGTATIDNAVMRISPFPGNRLKLHVPENRTGRCGESAERAYPSWCAVTLREQFRPRYLREPEFRVVNGFAGGRMRTCRSHAEGRSDTGRAMG
jgi:hypothetical protein